ncbi:MAG TPA: BatD family protein [Candidatus Goldiibacteriota bacterium]|nr:BatD family protein [Candidatus Goldiibacteriota bacterium]
MKRIVCVFFAVAIMAQCAFAQNAVEARAEVDRKSVKLGDVITYTITVKREGAGGASPEVEPPSFEGFRVMGSYSQNSVSIINNIASITTALQYQLMAVKSGEVTIQPAKVYVRNPVSGQREQFATKAVTVTVAGGRGTAPATATPAIPIETPTPVPAPARADIREIKMSLSFRFSDILPYLILAAVFIAVLAVAWKIIFKKRELAAPALTEVDYRKEALKMLKKAYDRLGRGDIKGFYYDIYEAVRFFTAVRIGESLDELTTREIQSRIQGKLSEGKVERIIEFMNDCDIVKFADYSPKPDEAEEAYKRAGDIIEKT